MENIAILSAVDPSIFHMSTDKTLKFLKSDTHDPYLFPFFFLSTDPYVSYCVYCKPVHSTGTPTGLPPV